jgi:hypothetical protein
MMRPSGNTTVSAAAAQGRDVTLQGGAAPKRDYRHLVARAGLDDFAMLK